MYREAVSEGHRLRIHFDHADGLQAKGGGPLKGFYLAGANKRFYPATAVIEGTSVVLSAEQVTRAYAARYAWAAYAEATLYNGDGLPASPFGLACGEP
jgi:sialate O-acetylesterase